jgi:hypothetical protein
MSCTPEEERLNCNDLDSTPDSELRKRIEPIRRDLRRARSDRVRIRRLLRKLISRYFRNHPEAGLFLWQSVLRILKRIDSNYTEASLRRTLNRFIGGTVNVVLMGRVPPHRRDTFRDQIDSLVRRQNTVEFLKWKWSYTKFALRRATLSIQRLH